VTFELGRALLSSGSVTPDELARALGVTLEPGMPLARALVGLGVMREEDLQRELAKGDTHPPLAEVEPLVDLLSTLPTGICNRLAALPVHVDPDGAVQVAVLDARDSYVAQEMAYHLRRPVRLVRAPYTLLREALVQYAASLQAVALPPGARRERRRAMSYTPAWGTPVDPTLAQGTESSPDPSPAAAHPSPVVASVTTATRRFFAGMHSAPSEPPVEIPMTGEAGASIEIHDREPVFELRRGPNMTLTDLEPPTTRLRDAPAFPLVASLPKALPSTSPREVQEHFPDPASTLGKLEGALDRDEVLGLVEKSARAVARRVALLVVRKNVLVGWSCSPEFGSRDALRNVSISTRTPSLLTTVLAGGVYLGPLLGSVGAALLRVMGNASRDVALVALRVKGKPAVLVVCDELGDTLLATRHLDIMAKVAGDALERVVKARRGEGEG
jgi:Type II secretion system (T2SS), protein E, N-terminal domain